MNGMVHRLRIVVSLVFAAGLGAAVWALSPKIVGAVEPWDGPFWYYPTALFVAGMLGAVPWPLRPGLALVGVAVGQLVYAMSLPVVGASFWMVGLVVGAVYLLFVMAGTGTTYAVYAWRFKEWGGSAPFISPAARRQ
jgi:hypothetical protein